MSEALKTPPKFVNIEDENTYLRSKNATQGERITTQERKIKDLEFRIKEFRRVLFGPRSEKAPAPVNEKQLQIFESLCKNEEDETLKSLLIDLSKPEDKNDSDEKEPAKTRKRRKPSVVLETQEIVIEPTDEELIGKNGEKLLVIGYETSERIDSIPRKLIRVIIKRAILGDPQSRDYEKTVDYTTIVPKGKLTDRFIHEIIQDKFLMGLPLYRQLKELNRLGAELTGSIMSDSVKAFAKFYAPICDAIRLEAFSTEFVQADESPIQMGKRHIDAEGKVRKSYKTGYFWVFRNRVACYFHFGPTRSYEELETVLTFDDEITNNPHCGGYEKKACFGYFMSDAHSAYGKAYRKGILKAILMACWAHVRRKFEAMAKQKNPQAQEIFELINNLYRVERKVNKLTKKLKLNRKAEAKLRLEHRAAESTIIMEAIWKWIDNESLTTVEGTAMYQAVGYAQNLRKALQVYLTNGTLPIDNNAAENAIRPMVIGRKNYLFVGSEDAGTWAAAAYSLTESCRVASIDFRGYLQYTTNALHQGRTDYENLTPNALRKKIKSIPRDY